VLGTAIIVGSLIVGDTLNFSVKQNAYRYLGVVDEVVSSPTPTQGDQAARRLATLGGDPASTGCSPSTATRRPWPGATASTARANPGPP
jgi:putative ABC transport system permease protein